MIEYLGRCHCGALTVRYRTAVDPADWSVRACQCSFCRAHGSAATSDPAGEMEFRSVDPEKVQRYRFGTRTADAILCRECGVFLGVEMQTEAGRFGVVNVQTLRPRPVGLAAPQSVDFGEERVEARLSRRVARWTPVVPGRL